MFPVSFPIFLRTRFIQNSSRDFFFETRLTDKRLKKVTKTKRKKSTKKAQKSTKSSFVLQILTSIMTRFCCFISLVFNYQENTGIFSLLTIFLKFFMFLFYFTNKKCKMKVQRQLCTNLLHFF